MATPDLLYTAHEQLAAGRLADATQTFRRILAAEPNNFDALHALGCIELRSGRTAEGEKLLSSAVKSNPTSAAALSHLGFALQQLGRHAEALACHDRALSLRPDFAASLAGRADSLLALRRHDEALVAYDAALRLLPSHGPLWHNRGITCWALNRLEDALGCFQRALTVNAQDTESLACCGKMQSELGRFEDALTAFEAVLKIKPDHLAARLDRATIFSGFKRYAEAADDFSRVLLIAPDYPYLRGERLQARLYCCHWTQYAHDKAAIAAAIEDGKPAAMPMPNISWCDSEAIQQRCASIRIDREFPRAEISVWRGNTYVHERIRIAYLSPEFEGNPVSTQIVGVFEHHDRTRFETVLAPFGRDYGSAMRRRVTAAFEHVIDIRGMADRDAAGALHRMEIDIAVDLAGLVGNTRTGVFACRFAPVQVNYLGYPATMGASYMDYIIADRTIIPEASQRHYTERVIYLPDTYMPCDSMRRAGPPASRADAGLPEGKFVFCAFNNSFKITPEVFGIWTSLLRAIPDSVLWLPGYTLQARVNLKREASARGITPERLLFARYEPSTERYLAQLALADLFLDTLPYNAHSTACDALAAGLPVLTFMGPTFAGRVGASILHAAGVPELIASDLREYEEVALRLASEPESLAALRARLKTGRDRLFDTARFTRNLEAAYINMYERALSIELRQ